MINVIIPLDDIGLFRKRRSHELFSQRERAEQIRAQFAECMTNTLNGIYCYMPDLCANGALDLRCAHLHVDYANFTGNGIPLPMRARTKFDSRLRAIGTQVFREQTSARGPLAGDIHIPSLAKIAEFTGTRGAPRRPKGKHRAAPKRSGFFARLFG